jgi:hypothetical protein
MTPTIWHCGLKAAVVGVSKFFGSNVSGGSQYQLQSGKPAPGLDGKEPRSARKYCVAKKYFELVGLLY